MDSFFCEKRYYSNDKMRRNSDKSISRDTILAELVASNSYLLLLLDHFNIDLMLQEKTIGQVCNENQIRPEIFILFISLFNGDKSISKVPYKGEDILSIINYLRSSHTFYNEEKYPQIRQYIGQINLLNKIPEIVLLDRFFTKYFDEVREHLEYENSTVFPYIEGLASRLKGESTASLSLDYSVSQYRDHHDNIEEKLSDLKNLLIKYMPVGNDKEVRRKLLFSLSELEFDLHIHSQIEDFILIPMVEQMESQLNSRYGR